MSDPITIGAAVGAGTSLIRGDNPLKGAALGAVGGAGYGAVTGSGMAGNLISQGGMLGGGAAAGAGTSVVPGATGVTGTTGMISPFTPQGVAGVQTMTPGLTGAAPILGQAGEQALAQGANLYSGRQGMFDTLGGVSNTPGVSNAIMTGATQQGGGGYDNSFLGSMGRFGDKLTGLAEENPMITQTVANTALQNMLQPRQVQPVNPPTGPSSIPSQQSREQYVPRGLMSQVQRNMIPEYQRLYGF